MNEKCYLLPLCARQESEKDCNWNVYLQWKALVTSLNVNVSTIFLPQVNYTHLILGTNCVTIIFTKIEIEQPHWKLIDYI